MENTARAENKKNKGVGGTGRIKGNSCCTFQSLIMKSLIVVVFNANYRMNGSSHLIFLASLFLCLEVLVELRREEGLAEALVGLGIVRFLFQGREVILVCICTLGELFSRGDKMEREKTVEKGRGGNHTDGFVHAQDQTTRLHRCLNRVDLH